MYETIKKEELSKKLNEKEPVQLINVLSHEYDHLGMIQSSKKIPLDDLDQRLGELDKSREVITYCASYECNASRKAAEKLAAQGFTVKAYEGGLKEWKSAGFPVEEEAVRENSNQNQKVA